MLRVYLRQAVENNKIIFPGKFCRFCEEHKNNEPLKCLECLRKAKTPHSFSSQYMNDPIDSDAVEFKTEWLQKFEFTTELVQMLNSTAAIMSIDPAVTTNTSSDFTGICVCKMLPGNKVYVLEAMQKKMSPPQLIDEVFKLRATYKIHKVLLETNSAQFIFLSAFKQEMIKRRDFFTIEEVKSSTRDTKAMRIRGMIPFYANGLVFHRPGLSELEYQLIQFPRNTHDDIIDALAHQVPYWKKGADAVKPKDIAPYGSLNWWKKQDAGKKKSSQFERIFGDLI